MKTKKIILWTVILLAIVLTYFQYLSTQTTTLDHQVFVNNTPEKVWEVLYDIESVEHYNPMVKKATCISTVQAGVNASRECKMIDESTVKERIIDVEPNKALTMELYESTWPVHDMKWRTAIEAKETGTLVTQKLEYKVKYGALGALLNTLMMRNKMDASLQEVFTGLKNYTESK